MLRRAWHRWKAVAQVIGDFQGRVILTLFYFIVLAPAGLIVRAFSDPLRLKRPVGSSTWTRHQSEPSTLERARKQY